MKTTTIFLTLTLFTRGLFAQSEGLSGPQRSIYDRYALLVDQDDTSHYRLDYYIVDLAIDSSIEAALSTEVLARSDIGRLNKLTISETSSKEALEILFEPKYRPYFCERYLDGNSRKDLEECRRRTFELIEPIHSGTSLQLYLVEVRATYYGEYRAITIAIGPSHENSNTFLLLDFDIIHEI